METNSCQTQKFWRSVGKNVQLVFQQGIFQLNSHEQLEAKNSQISNQKICSDDDLSDDEAYLLSQGPSRQIIQFQQNQNQNKKIEASIKQENFILDETSGVYMTTSRSHIPNIIITINQAILSKNKQQQNSQDSLILQVMLCQKSSCPQRQKFKVIKGALSGCSRKKVHEKSKIQFKGLKFNYNSNPDKNSKLIIALYKINKDRIRTYIKILVSRDLFLIEDGKAIFIDSYQSLYQYFQNFGVQFMERPPSTVKINKQDKHSYHQQISSFQKYLIKKNKKVSNIIYLSFKFPHFIDLYFKVNQNQQNQNQHQQKYLNLNLTNSLKQILDQISQGKYLQNDKQLVCNHFNPDCKILLRINTNMRRVRFFMKKQFTRLMSIIASEDQPQQYPGFQKFPSNKQLKEFYLQYHAISLKYKPTNSQNAVKSQTISQLPSIINTLSGVQNNTSDKKNTRKDNDQDYHEEQEEDILQNQSDQSQNYSLSEKKNKKIHKKAETKKSQNNFANTNSKQIKYPTRHNKVKQNQNFDDQDSKKNIINKKIKQKQLHQTQQIKKTMPIQGGFLGNGMPPFQIVNPNMPQAPTMGVFPMVQNIQALQGLSMQNSMNKQGNQGQNKPNSQMPQQLIGMPIGPNGIPLGGMPMMPTIPPGMIPFGIMPNPILAQKKDPNNKDNKQQNQNQMPKIPQMPGGVMPMMINPAMLASMQGGIPGMHGQTAMSHMGVMGQSQIPNMVPVGIPTQGGMMYAMMPNPAAQQGNGQNGQNQNGNNGFFSQGMPMMMPMNIPLGMNPQNNQNGIGNDKAQNSMMIPNPMTMAMMPGQNPLMMNPAMFNMIQQQMKNNQQKKDQLNNQNINQQPNNLNKNVPSQFNALQKNTEILNQKNDNNKKNDKSQGNFPGSMQMVMPGMANFGGIPMPMPMSMPPGMQGFGQNPQGIQGMMMFPPGMNPNILPMNPSLSNQMNQGLANQMNSNHKQKNQQSQKQNMGQNNLPMNGIMGFPGIMSNNGNGNGITPQMLQQLSQQQGGNPMLMGGNGMFPPNLGMQLNNQKPNPNQNGMNNINGMFGMQPPNNQDMANMMRQQQMAEMMRNNGGNMFMPGGMPSMNGMNMPGMGMQSMFMPPKKDQDQKK